MGTPVPLDDIPPEYLTEEEQQQLQQNSALAAPPISPGYREPPATIPTGGVFALPRDNAMQAASPVGALTGTETGQSLLNGILRGALRLPSNIVAGIPTLAMDVGQTIFGGPGKKGETSFLGGTPWEETLTQDDWASAISTTAADKLFAQGGGIDKNLGFSLYDTRNPSGFSRYAGSVGEAAGSGGPLGALARAPGVGATIGSGLLSQFGQDALPGSKYAGPIGGLLGALGGGVVGGAIQPKPPSTTPSWDSLRADVAKETNDPNILYYSPEVQTKANQITKASDIKKIRQMVNPDARDAALADMISPPMPPTGPPKFSLLTEVELAHILGKRNPAENAFWRAVDLASKKLLSPMAKHGLKMAKAAYDKANEEPKIRIMLEQLDDVIRTQKRIPRTDFPRIGKNTLKTGVGQLDEEEDAR